jgi:hypothetical protein
VEEESDDRSKFKKAGERLTWLLLKVVSQKQQYSQPSLYFLEQAIFLQD